MEAKARASSLGMTGWCGRAKFNEGLRGWGCASGGASRVFVFPALPGGAKLCRAYGAGSWVHCWVGDPEGRMGRRQGKGCCGRNREL